MSTLAGPEVWRPSASLAAIRARGAALRTVREFFAARDVLEVQTPLLGQCGVTDPQIGGFAVVAPFDSSGDSSGDSSRPEGRQARQGVLQTSTEYHQKRLLAAGLGDNYTLGPVFRAAEQGRLHNPEFTMLEWYRLGFDDRALMLELVELVDVLLGAADYQTHHYAQLLERAVLTEAERREVPAMAHGDLLLTKALDELGGGRHFVVGYPAAAAVLAKLDPADPKVARRFELVIDGIEIANGYFELTDATVHRERFECDQAARLAQGLEAVQQDDALLAAVDAGLPDCAGVAVGFDRLLMLQLGVATIAEVQAFDWARR